MYDHYLPVVLAALTVLILGCWNPRQLQSHQNGVPSGHPSYVWLAVISLIVGLVACYLVDYNKHGRRLEL